MTVPDRFWSKVEKSDTCWAWLGGHTQTGYGTFSVNGRVRRLAHRFSWAMHTGHDPPADMDVCHRCDNPACVRPSHLFVGTRKANMRDSLDKNRFPRGERQWMAKLTDDVVSLARKQGWSAQSLAAIGDVHPNTARKALIGFTWKHVP
jgi:hypothetical protein